MAPPSIGQDFKGDLATYWPLSRIHQYAAPPNRKYWLRQWTCAHSLFIMYSIVSVFKNYNIVPALRASTIFY